MIRILLCGLAILFVIGIWTIEFIQRLYGKILGKIKSAWSKKMKKLPRIYLKK